MLATRLHRKPLQSTRKYLKGEYIHHQGDAMERVLVIQSGMVSFSVTLEDGRRQITGIQCRGAVIGNTAGVVTSAPEIQALTDVTAHSLSHRDFSHCVAFRKDLLDLAERTIKAQRMHITLLGCGLANERIAAFLLSLLHCEHDTETSDGATVTIPMEGVDVGNYLGMKRETLSRTLGELDKGGLITRQEGERNTVSLDNLEKLYELAGFTAEGRESIFVM